MSGLDLLSEDGQSLPGLRGRKRSGQQPPLGAERRIRAARRIGRRQPEQVRLQDGRHGTGSRARPGSAAQVERCRRRRCHGRLQRGSHDQRRSRQQRQAQERRDECRHGANARGSRTDGCMAGLLRSTSRGRGPPGTGMVGQQHVSVVTAAPSPRTDSHSGHGAATIGYCNALHGRRGLESSSKKDV